MTELTIICRNRKTGIKLTETLAAALLLSSFARAVVVLIFLPHLRETRLVRPISPTALTIRVIRANIVAEWLFELLPSRGRATKKR
ncbi:MAG: hypothetical protein WD823_02900 [Sulfuricaulis sp.]|uniref:hypothetical protein n=1 Tax=Sulfuricaulis sp. TaxID=2003553 RepID=UPI0034A5545E